MLTDLNVSLGIEQNIIAFDISVYDALSVQVLKSFASLVRR